ncbi:hypothetical protein Rifp1Sym_cs00020 [endosymbiont of Riftia pachyptila (vent Ph05)]|uniref:Uncharacterized protein n=1 Tax=endosymbiont of Riftia pachyptila (vent Ph05) TaxID=1048808 RepID=G2DFI9_9GAMM|nr:hypothetical protein Rifp1Sym_cs00020 [endosymbiont of Riftia pachyptila (vent Ph05)]
MLPESVISQKLDLKIPGPLKLVVLMEAGPTGSLRLLLAE